jgi:hypothetical protein
MAKPRISAGDIVIPAAQAKKNTQSWEEQVLKGIGAPLSPANVKFLDAWQATEATSAANNPLATTMPANGATVLSGNPAGVKNYPDAATGIDATVRTLRNYKGIVAAFKTGDAAQAAQANTSGFGVWSGNRDNPAGAAHYVRGILSHYGSGTTFQASTPGASTQTAKATAQAQATEAGQAAYTEAQRAAESLKLQRAKLAVTDPYIDDKGNILKGVAAPPQNGIPSTTGDMLRLSEFEQLRSRYADTYYAFAGKPIPNNVVIDLATSPKSLYQVKQELVRQKGFVNTPAWKANARDYIAVAQSTYGDNYKPPVDMIKNAILNNVTQTGFAQQLKSRPEYERSNVFKQQAASLSTVYEGIYGTPDENSQAVVHAAVKHGWDQTQFQQYLRAQPAYTQSNEYQTKQLDLLTQLGLITGGVAVLKPSPATGYQGNPLIPGAGMLTGTTDAPPNPNVTDLSLPGQRVRPDNTMSARIEGGIQA